MRSLINEMDEAAPRNLMNGGVALKCSWASLTGEEVGRRQLYTQRYFLVNIHARAVSIHAYHLRHLECLSSGDAVQRAVNETTLVVTLRPKSLEGLSSY